MTEETKKEKGVHTLPAIIELAGNYALDASAFCFTFKQVAMPDKHTDAEFVSCCLVAREHGLNPLTKEIYFMRDKHGKIQAIVGVDGWIKKANEHPQFDGIVFHDNLDPKTNKIVSIRAQIHRKDRSHPIEVTEYLAECLQQRDKAGPWQTHPARMLRHRALIQCARVAFGFAGVMDPDEFSQWDNMRDVTPPSGPTVPDIPEPPSSDPSAARSEVDEPLADETGWLAHFEEEMGLAGKDEELRAEVWDANVDIIEGRLSKEGRARVERLRPFREAAE
jgi:phage recombination protein Bet